MFDRRKEKLPIQLIDDRRIPVLTESRMQQIWQIVSEKYVDKLQKAGTRESWRNVG